MKWTCTPNLLLIALTSAAPLQTPPFLEANFDDLQPGTRLQRTPYKSLQFSGLIVKDKGPRAIFPDTEPNYALQYYGPGLRGSLMSVEDPSASFFDLNGFAAGCLWDTAKSGVGAGNLSTAPLPPITGTAGETSPATGSLNNGTDSLDAAHYPCIACTIVIRCQRASGKQLRHSVDWRPGTSWSSNIMGRYFGLAGWRGLSLCNIRVTGADVDLEEVILVLDSIQYRLDVYQAAEGTPAVDVT